MIFKAIKIKDRLPDFNQRIFFFDSKYGQGFGIESGHITEYNPNEKIEVRKGQMIEFKDCKLCIDNILQNFDYWLEFQKD